MAKRKSPLTKKEREKHARNLVKKYGYTIENAREYLSFLYPD